MGIDVHSLNFIRYAARRQRLGRVASMGRQELAVPGLAAKFGRYCEALLFDLGAEVVESYDFSNYQGATHMVDMSRPLAPGPQYDTIIDCGTLEHVFNVPQALINVSQLCRVGGQIIHVLPANNFCGHGFWQFSPELFFSLYSETNGYSETEVFLADLRNTKVWYEVERPTEDRVEAMSKCPLYVMCRTVRSNAFSHENIQQSDYIPLWNRQTQPESTGFMAGLKTRIKKKPLLYRSASIVHKAIRRRLQLLRNPASLSNRNPHLRKLHVSRLLKD